MSIPSPDWSDMDSLEPGTLLARRYRLLDRIGIGGMSVIWRAHDEMLDRGVAVKVLAADLAADSRCRDLVRTEARAAAALRHPHVTATYDYGETVDARGEVIAYVVMELLEGAPLSARLTEGPLPWTEALRICAEVAEALAAAHRHGIVHRDLTADNVMLTADGSKLLDFGIATTVGAPDEDADGLTFGTPAYVAPERLDGRRARPANDTYALGVLLFETLTGHPPYPAETWEELATTRDDPPPPLRVPGLPAPVARLYLRCLDRDPQQRPTAHQAAWTLRRQLPGPDRPVVHRSRLRRALTAAGAVATLALGVLIGANLLGGGPVQVLEPRPDTYADSGDDPPDPGLPPGTDPVGEADREPGEAEQPGPRVTPTPAPTDPAPSESAPADRAPAGDGGTQLTGSPATNLDTLENLVVAGQQSGDIRDDVAQDLYNQIGNLRLNLATDSIDLATGVSQLWDKVRARENEGSLGRDSAAALYAALDDLSSQA